MKLFHKKQRSSQALLAIDEITDHSIRTQSGELVYFILQPHNLNVLPEQAVRRRIRELMNVLKGMAEVELLALDARESFQDNRSFYRQRLEREKEPAICALLAQDCRHLDDVRLLMASARVFCLVLRQRQESSAAHLANVEKQIADSGFAVHRAGEQALRELLAVYFEQDVSHEVYDSVDGARYAGGAQ